ncbi:hypothetical protein BDZ97DRAFT_1760216 [Flammula alnicola]|nr:hypothetical protein BDZ97DRAFT_1760216 [Flammula alnicola]
MAFGVGVGSGRGSETAGAEFKLDGQYLAKPFNEFDHLETRQMPRSLSPEFICILKRTASPGGPRGWRSGTGQGRGKGAVAPPLPESESDSSRAALSEHNVGVVARYRDPGFIDSYLKLEDVLYLTCNCSPRTWASENLQAFEMIFEDNPLFQLSSFKLKPSGVWDPEARERT